MRRSALLTLPALFALGACGHAGSNNPSADAGAPDAGITFDATYSAGPFQVAAGTEIVMCTFVRGQNAQDEDVQSFLTQQSVGGHHLIVYTVDHPIDLPPTPCSQGGQPSWVQVLGTQNAETQITNLPSGVGFHGKGRQQFVMETHYINATSGALTVQSSFALKYSVPGTVTQQAHPYFFGSLNLNIPAGQSWSTTATCAPPQAVSIYSMVGHIHRFGTQVTVGFIPGADGGSASGDGGVQPLYSTAQWDSPPATVFPNGLALTPADKLQVTCEWNNTSNEPLSYPQEMCYAIGLYWPGPGTLFCVHGGGDDTTCQCGFQGAIDTGSGGSTIKLEVNRQDSLSGVAGDSPSSGHPIYCSLFRAQDWPATSPQPAAGVSPYYQTDIEGMALTSSTTTAELTFNDVTPGDYSAFCFMDTISGGLIPGPGDPINYPVVAVTAVLGQTATAQITLDLGLPKL